MKGKKVKIIDQKIIDESCTETFNLEIGENNKNLNVSIIMMDSQAHEYFLHFINWKGFLKYKEEHVKIYFARSFIFFSFPKNKKNSSKIK